MDQDICGLIRNLAKCHIRVCVLEGRDLVCRLDPGDLTRKLVKTIYEVLLTYHGSACVKDPTGNLTAFDRLYAVCFEKRRLGKCQDTERLCELTDRLRSLPPNLLDDLQAVLVFLLNLAQDDDDGTGQSGTGFELPSRANGVAADASRYTCFPHRVFEKVGMNFTGQRYGQGFLDAKMFSMKPGFFSATGQLKCNRAGPSWPPKDRHLATSLYGALTRPLSDPWRVDTKLEIPELSDEPGTQLRSLTDCTGWRSEPQTGVSAMDIPVKDDRMATEEDEGFIETDTPTSTNSFGHGVDATAVWEQALTADYFKNPPNRCRTWEALGCLEPVLEKPFLTEAGPEALDHLVISLRNTLSIICPSEAARALLDVRRCQPSEIAWSALNALLGIPSDVFSFDEKSCSFSAAAVSVSGLSPESLQVVLSKFAVSATYHVRLERLAASDKPCSLVFQAFANGVKRYLFHRQVVVTFLMGRRNGSTNLDSKEQPLQLLQLMRKTDKLRYQTRFLAELCGLATSSEAALPAGVGLLRHLYEVASQSSCNPDTFPVSLSLLHRASWPYFQFLRKWVFEGSCEDRYDEFPVAVDGESPESAADDEGFWTRRFTLRDEGYPILASLLPKVFVCGKSVDLLRRCCPNHPLCRSRPNYPSLALAFSESDMRQLAEEYRQYVADVETELRNLRPPNGRKLESPHGRKEPLRRTRRVVRISPEKSEGQVSGEVQIDLPTDDHSADLRDQQSVAVELTDRVCERNSLVALPVSVVRDFNANPVELTPAYDFNANEDVCVSTENDVDPVVGRAAKGTKRKQDRESIDFEVLAARRPVRTMDQLGTTDCAATRSAAGILVECSTFQVLRSRGRSNHGHASDSTIQKLLYGSMYLKRKDLPETNASSDVPPDAEATEESLEQLVAKVFGGLKMPPYEIDMPLLDSPPLADIGNFSSPSRKYADCETSSDQGDANFWKNQSLPVLFECCILTPLRTQISLVDRSLLDCFLHDLKLREHFSFLHDHFFMQDGEFSQCLCDHLFERFARSTSPSDLLNPLTLNSILSKALSYSASAALTSALDESSGFESNLAFVVKFMPQAFQPNSPNVLDCLRLSYRVHFPTNIVLSSEVSKYYERVFGFLLQLRRCLWASTDAYRILKLHDPAARSTRADTVRVKRYRLLQLYRHEMHHFLRCLQEHLNLQAFQATYLKFETDLDGVQCLDGLIATHVKYLKKVFFRCLLHKKAAPVMKIVRKIFAVILKFRTQLVSASDPAGNETLLETETFAQLQAAYKIFKEYSTYLFQVITKLVRCGYQPPLQEFLTRLDCNDWYSSAIRQANPPSS